MNPLDPPVSRTLNRPTATCLLVAAALIPALTGCGAILTENTTGGSEGAVAVTSTADECRVSTDTVDSGPVTFSVTNEGDAVTEFYILAEDGLRVVGEVENIGPKLRRELVVNAQPGTYHTVCKPGMVGSGVGKAVLTVKDSGKHAAAVGTEEQRAAIVDNYLSYAREQAEQLLTGTEKFAAAYSAGRDEEARGLYAPTRTHFERIETLAESFGDLDPKLDLREADVEPGARWTGWHAAEKDLWAPAGYQPRPAAEKKALADELVADTKDLVAKIRGLEGLTIDELANGAIGLMDEVATTKVTGEEEVFSKTDLWDFQGNVDGAKVLYGGVRDLVVQKDKALAEKLDKAFADLQAELDRHRAGDGFVAYDQLTKEQVRALSDKVTAVGEPLSKLTATLIS